MKRIFSLSASICLALSALAATYSGTLPVMFINTANSQPITNKTNYVAATYYIDALGLDGYENVGSAAEPLGLQIRGRGNWTWTGFDKKPYRIKLDAKTQMPGLDKSKHFALLACADDSYGFLRNPVGFWLSKALGMEWTPSTEPIEVVLNGDYIGLYFLTETIRVDKNRVNVVEQPDYATSPEQITGGWLVEIDNYDSDPHISITEGDGRPIIFTYKSPEALSPEQDAYLSDQMSAINTAVYSDDTDLCTWATMVDLEELAKFYIVQEITDNYESFHGSCYLHKQQGDNTLWQFGPVWDFGSAFNYDKSQYCYQGREHHQTWIGHMCRFPAFMDILKRIWSEFYSTQYYSMLEYVDDFASRISAAAYADSERWPQYGNADEMARAQVVKQRLTRACEWLAKQWGGQQQPIDRDPITVYYISDGPKQWDQVYVYSWDRGPDGWYNLYGDWPGSPMEPTTLNGQPAWTLTVTPQIEMSHSPGLIFNNGHSGVEKGNQTQDLVLYNGGVYHYDGLLSGITDAVDNALEIKVVAPATVEICSPDARTVTATGIDGRTRRLHLQPGTNTFTLPRGFYIISHTKLAL